MEHEFWHQRWQENRIGFHQLQPSPFLIQYFNTLKLASNARIFVPLSGKTLDISWLIQQGYRVVAIELSQIAVVALIEQLFEDFKFDFEISEKNNLIHYAHPQIDIFVGDFFDLAYKQLGHVDAIYDRAALVALPADMRNHYTQHLMHITHTAPQFLVSYEYNQAQFSGPPFSVDSEEIQQLYGDSYHLQLLAHLAHSEQFKRTHAQDKIWYLQPKTKA